MSNDKDFKVKKGVKPTVYHEKLGTVVSGTDYYSLSAASYDSLSFNVSAQTTAPQALFFKDDGTKMYFVSAVTDVVYQYTLSTAWNVSTATYDSVSFSVASQETVPLGLAFGNSGTKMYIVGQAADSINEYTLSTAWNIGTASFASRTFSVASQELNPQGMFFKSDGQSLYIVGEADIVYQYSLSTPWDISTASYSSKSFNAASQASLSRDLFFNSSGTRLFVVCSTTDTVFQYSLSTAWDVSTASYSGVSFSVAGQSTAPTGLFFSSTGEKMYVTDQVSSLVYQYSTTIASETLDLSTGSVFQLTPASNIQLSLSNPAASGTVSGATLLLDGAAVNTYDLSSASYDSVSFSVAAQDTAPNEVFFKPDGTKMYILGATNDAVFEYNLSTAWVVSTSSYVQSFSVASQESIPTGMSFKPDGTKMYIVGQAGDDVNEYNLSTAWSVGTATYVQSFSVATQDTDPYAVTFKPDGTKMYVVGGIDDDIIEYNLGTAWDVSTASYLQAFAVSAQDILPISVAFKSDGTKMFVLGRTNDTVYEYNLSTAWDVSTASYSGVSFSVTSQETSPNGLFFKSDGTAFYVVGSGSDTVYQYSVGSTATITYDSSVDFPGGTAPTSPAIGDTDVLVFTTRDGGTSYKAALAIDGAA